MIRLLCVNAVRGRRLALVAGAVLAGTAPATAALLVTVEAPHVLNTTSTFSFSAIETFDARQTGAGQSFASTFGGSSVTGIYSGINVVAADQWGGALGVGAYGTSNSVAGYSIDLATTNPAGINYFGYWVSALNSGNLIQFFDNVDLVGSFDASQLDELIGANPLYHGNPSGLYVGQGNNEPFAFINFYSQGGTFDRIVISGGGHESDNHTVGNYVTSSGTIVQGAVPEPATWASLILGFGAVGGSMRSRRKVAVSFG